MMASLFQCSFGHAPLSKEVDHRGCNEPKKTRSFPHDREFRIGFTYISYVTVRTNSVISNVTCIISGTDVIHTVSRHEGEIQTHTRYLTIKIKQFRLFFDFIVL
jgi:hypothetical protein